jgi:hypothetical protein
VARQRRVQELDDSALLRLAWVQRLEKGDQGYNTSDHPQFEKGGADGRPKDARRDLAASAQELAKNRQTAQEISDPP